MHGPMQCARVEGSAMQLGLVSFPITVPAPRASALPGNRMLTLMDYRFRCLSERRRRLV